jgi:elongation factor P
MSISPNDIKIGSVFRRDGKVLKVLDKQHVKLSKGGACQQVKCLDVETGSISEIRLNVQESLDEVYMDRNGLTYAYTDGDTAYFTNQDCETVEISLQVLGSIAGLFEGSNEFDHPIKVEVESFKDLSGKEKIVNVKLLEDVTLEIVDTRPSIKGEAAKTGTKAAVAKGGFKVKVPPHVNVGDMVVLSKVDLSEF